MAWSVNTTGDRERAQERNEFGSAEACVPHLDHVPQRPPFGAPRQQFQEFAEIGGIELFGRRELPEHRPQPVAQFQ